MDTRELNYSQKILAELIRVRRNNIAFYLSDSLYAENKVISGGWRPGYYFQTKSIGGSDAIRRIRKLRDAGNGHNVPIELKAHQYTDGMSKDRSVYIYRLALTVEQVNNYNWDNAWSKPFAGWRFNRIDVFPLLDKINVKTIQQDIRFKQ